MKITVTRQELSTALLFASADESRYILNGVCLKTRGEGNKPLLVSTDGHRLSVIESIAGQPEEGSVEGEIILRGGFLQAIVKLSKALGGKLFPWITLESRAGSKQLKCEIVGTETYIDCEKSALIEGQFPDWRNVIPGKKEKREPVNELGFNAEQVGDYSRAAKMLDCDNPLVQMSIVGKDSAIEVKLLGYPGFYGLVMPSKLRDDVEYQPKFLGIVKDMPTHEQNPQPETEKE